MTNTLYITKVEMGYALETEQGLHYGIADTLSEAIQSAKDIVEMGEASTYCIND